MKRKVIRPRQDDKNAIEFLKWMTDHAETFNLPYQKVELLRRFIKRREQVFGVLDFLDEKTKEGSCQF